MSKVFEISSIPWEPVRPEITTGILGRSLLDGDVKATLTRVAPGGKFRKHKDKYGHLYYFIQGEGTLQVGTEQLTVKPGLVVQIAPGEQHAYENTGPGDLLLLSLNLPAAQG